VELWISSTEPTTTFQNYNKRLLNSIKSVCEATIKKVAKEVLVANKNNNNISVAVDWTFQKRDSWHNKVVTVTSIDTGKVIDVEEQNMCWCFKKFLNISDYVLEDGVF